MPPTAPRARRRSLLRAGVVVASWLAFGVVVNLLVAWWCVYRFENLRRKPGVTLAFWVGTSAGFLGASRVDQLPTTWTVDVPANFPAPETVVGGEFGWMYLTTEHFRAPPTEPTLRVLIMRMEVGWPLRCWWGADRLIRSALPEIKTDNTPVHCLRLPSSLFDLLGVERLPIGIHPLPFIANTLFYAASPRGLGVAAGPLRRRRRRRAGRCPRCGYDRAGLAAGAVCPECGHSSAPSV